MKRKLSLFLVFIFIIGISFCLPVSYAVYEEEGCFSFNFENEADIANSRITIPNSIKSFTTDGCYSGGAMRLKYSHSGSGSNQICTGVSQIRLFPNETYKFSMWMKVNNPQMVNPPNMYLTLSYQGVTVYSDPLLQNKTTDTWTYDQFVVTAAQSGFTQADGSCDDGWHKIEYIFKFSGKMRGNKYQDYANDYCSLYLRVGSANDDANDVKNYNADYVASVTDASGSINYSKLYIDFSIDDLKMERIAGENDENAIYNYFDMTSWQKACGLSWSTTGTASRTTDVPDSSSLASLKISNTSGNTFNWTQIQVDATGCNTKKIWTNRAYKVSYWAKATDAVLACANPKTQFIVQRLSNADHGRLDRTKGRYEIVDMPPFTNAWKKYEFIYYLPQETALSRSGEESYVQYINIRQEGLPKGVESPQDYAFWLDDFSIEPLDIVYNGDLAVTAAAEQNLPIIYNGKYYAAGTDPVTSGALGNIDVVHDPSYSAVSGSVSDRVMSFTDTENGFIQTVDVDNKKLYKVSFWAKGESFTDTNGTVQPITAAKQLPLYAIFDRSHTGTVRDNAVTEVNLSGYDGYGNKTQKSGDIPFYFYSGTIVTSYDHPYDEIELQKNSSGQVYEALVYDDFYDRLKSCNAQSGNAPTAWNYQYLNGINTDDTYQADTKDAEGAWMLTGEWKYYEGYYSWDYAGSHLRMPKFTIVPRVSASVPTKATYQLAGIKITEVTDSVYADEVLSAASDEEKYQDLITEDFEHGTGGLMMNGVQSEILNDSPSGFGHSLGVTSLDTSSTLKIRFGAEKNVTYDVSAWIKLNSDVPADSVKFEIWNKAKGETMVLRNEFKISGLELARGEWVFVSGSYTHDGTGSWISGKRFETVPVGYLEVSLLSGSEISYNIDDLTVIPHYDGNQTVTSDNLVAEGSFEGENPLSGWSWSKSSITVTAAEDGANGTAGSMYIQGTSKSWANVTRSSVDIRFGRKYKITFWAKALDEATVGKNVDFILDRAGSKTDGAVPNYEHLRDASNPNLTSEWKKYEIIYQNNTDTGDPCKPNVYFRVGSKIEDLYFAVDELEIYEVVSEYNVSSKAVLSGTGQQYTNVKAEFYGTGTAVKFFYRILTPVSEGFYNILASGAAPVNGSFTTTLQFQPAGNIVMDVNGADPYGFVGNTVKYSLLAPEYEESVSTNFVQEVWTKDLEGLSAEIRVSNNEPKNITGAIAFYDSENRLLSISSATEPYERGESKSFDIAAQSTEDAENAKLFCWDNATMKPMRIEKTISKITSPHVYYIDPVNGNDLDDGTFLNPIQTLGGAKYLIREALKNPKDDIYIVLKNGTYNMQKPFSITQSDTFASDQYNIIFTALETGNAVLSGGKTITGFDLYDADLNIYRAYVGTNTNSRQLFVNGVRAVKARSQGGLSDCVNLGKTDIGLTTTDTFLMNYKYIEDLELVFYQNWTHNRCQVASAAESNGIVTLTMDQPGWTKMANRSNLTSVQTPAYYENALELLDEEGEWYLDTHEGYVYYKPRFFEDINTAEIIMPVAEQLLKIEGDEWNLRKNITFRGIEFSYTTWNNPSTSDGVPSGQNNYMDLSTGAGVPDGAVQVTYVDNVNFYNCTLSRLGSTAMFMTRGIHNCEVIGNEFYEISGNAFTLGKVESIDRYYPTRPAVGIENVKVENNYFHKVAVDYMSGTAISAGFLVETSIAHNELYSMPYSGMHIGWGWGSTASVVTYHLDIANNYIHHVMNDRIFDGGAIYTLGNTAGTLDDPNTIRENYIHNVGNQYGALYPDEGSSFQKWTRNVVDLSANPKWYGSGSAAEGTAGMDARWLHIHTTSIHDIILEENYATTTTKLENGTDIQYQDPLCYPNANWPEAAVEIIGKSGIEPKYQDNFKYRMQEVRISEQYTVSAGEKMTFEPEIFTSKNKAYSGTDVQYYITTNNPSVVSIDGNLAQGLQKGTAVVTICVIENGILKSNNCVVEVQ